MAKAIKIMADCGGGEVSALSIGSRVVLITGENPTIERGWINGLNASRKADREALALAFTLLAQNRGAIVERRDIGANPGFHGVSIDLRITCNGVGVLLDISNLHGGEYALLHWHGNGPAVRDLSPNFFLAIGDLSARPHHKATSFPRDWNALANRLDTGLCLAARGEAFT